MEITTGSGDAAADKSRIEKNTKIDGGTLFLVSSAIAILLAVAAYVLQDNFVQVKTPAVEIQSEPPKNDLRGNPER